MMEVPPVLYTKQLKAKYKNTESVNQGLKNKHSQFTLVYITEVIKKGDTVVHPN